jgi:hypothetical protein
MRLPATVKGAYIAEYRFLPSSHTEHILLSARTTSIAVHYMAALSLPVTA